MTGAASSAEMTWKMLRSAGSAPDQIETDSNMIFIMAKPATAVARTSRPNSGSRPSVSNEDSVASKPACDKVLTSGGGDPPARHFTLTRRVDRLTRASTTVSRLESAPSMDRIQPAHLAVGTTRWVSIKAWEMLRLARRTSASDGRGVAPMREAGSERLTIYAPPSAIIR